MDAEPIRLELSKDQALVLFEWLAWIDKSGPDIFRHPAEEKVVWRMQGILEKALLDPFDPAYTRLIEEARNRVESDGK